jgi:hypothetical protein
MPNSSALVLSASSSSVPAAAHSPAAQSQLLSPKAGSAAAAAFSPNYAFSHANAVTALRKLSPAAFASQFVHFDVALRMFLPFEPSAIRTTLIEWLHAYLEVQNSAHSHRCIVLISVCLTLLLSIEFGIVLIGSLSSGDLPRHLRGLAQCRRARIDSQKQRRLARQIQSAALRMDGRLSAPL